MVRLSKIFMSFLFICLFYTDVQAAILTGVSEGKQFEISIGKGFSDSIGGSWGNTKYEIEFGGFLTNTIKGKIEVVDPRGVELKDSQKIDLTVGMSYAEGELPCGKVNFQHTGLIWSKLSGVICGEAFEMNLSASEVTCIDIIVDVIVGYFPKPAASAVRRHILSRLAVE